MQGTLLGLLACAALVDAFGFVSLQPLPLRRSSVRTCAISMAGFGTKPSAKDSKAPLDRKKSLSNYEALVNAGAKPYRVFARVQGEDKWYEVGDIASSPDSPDAACTVHKRLALESAVEMYITQLKPKAKLLELGYSLSGDLNDDIVVSKKEQNASVSPPLQSHGFKQYENAFVTRHPDEIFQQPKSAASVTVTKAGK